MVKSLKKYVSLLYMFIKTSLIKEMNKRENFLLLVVTTTFLNIYFIIFYLVLAGQLNNDLLGWNKYELLFFVGTEIMCHAMFMSFYFYNVFKLPDYIRTGSFDFFLIKPVNTRFILSTRNFNCSTFSQVLLGVVLTIYSYFQLGLKLTFLKLILYIIFIFNSVFIMYLIAFILMSLSFYFTKISSYGSVLPYRGFFAVYWFARRPEEIFSPRLIQLLTYVVPALLIINLPAKWMVKEVGVKVIIWSFAFSPILYCISRFIWKKGLNRYQSASS